MRTRPWMIALMCVLPAAHAQTAPTPAPAMAKPAAPATTAAPAKNDVQQGLRLGANIGELVKAAVAQQRARAAAQGSATKAGAATADATDRAAEVPAGAVPGTEIAVAPQDAQTPPIP